MGLLKQEMLEYCRYFWKAITCTSVRLVWTQCIWPLCVTSMASANSARPGVTRQHSPGHNPHLAPYLSYCKSEPQISDPVNIVNGSFCKVGSEFNGQNLGGSSLPGQKTTHSDGVTNLLLLPRWKICDLDSLWSKPGLQQFQLHFSVRLTCNSSSTPRACGSWYHCQVVRPNK